MVSSAAMPRWNLQIPRQGAGRKETHARNGRSPRDMRTMTHGVQRSALPICFPSVTGFGLCMRACVDDARVRLSHLCLRWVADCSILADQSLTGNDPDHSTHPQTPQPTPMLTATATARSSRGRDRNGRGERNNRTTCRRQKIATADGRTTRRRLNVGRRWDGCRIEDNDR